MSCPFFWAIMRYVCEVSFSKLVVEHAGWQPEKSIPCLYTMQQGISIVFIVTKGDGHGSTAETDITDRRD
ncbi:hypothetical protein SAMN05660830_01089 [Halodesulfovibrio aestuarii]|uniref:Uncharacterized protein n=1 Tax=Halodesulfovibrio aestuarii TaxID=126333 RepID=A0A8G2C8I1_9BACT|nr:hypothetical protein SAMN05660830_01089 [Halodesulfovibrio aestuarii]